MAKKATVSGKGLGALLDKKKSVKGKSTAKGKNVPVKAQKEVFEVIIRIPWDMHKIVLDYGETKKGYREVPTFNGSLKKIIPEFARLQKENQLLKESLSSLQRKDQVRSGILSRLRSSLEEVLSPVPEVNKDNNYELPLSSGPNTSLPGIGGAYGRDVERRELRGKTKSCPACGKQKIDVYADGCPQCGEGLDEDDED